MSESNGLSAPVRSLTGVGSHLESRLRKLGIVRIFDLLLHLPLRYEDRTRITAINTLQPGQMALISGQICDMNNSAKSLIVTVSDASGSLPVFFFGGRAYLAKQFKPGMRLSCYGEVKPGLYGPSLLHPDFQILTDNQQPDTATTLTPIYPSTEGLTQKTLRSLIKQALTRLTPEQDLLPHALRQRWQLPDWPDSLNALHHPASGQAPNPEQRTPALTRLALEELLSHQLSLRAAPKRPEAPPLCLPADWHQRMTEHLPFALTETQQRVITEILADLTLPQPMSRLVQGDVGCGKTVVAAYAVLATVASGFQAAVMAPTELLAEQHQRNFQQWLAPFGLSPLLLTGADGAQARRHKLAELDSGLTQVVIGTHALFQEQVNFARLGLVIIDEQHRFGVHQRLALRGKGSATHQLIMTATPIPRTLAMLNYSDMALSIIDQRPPGRRAVMTRAIANTRRAEVIERIAHWTQTGQQTYWVCTLIEESESLQCEAAENTAQRLAEQLPDVRIGLLHGRMKTRDKDQVMADFKNGAIDLLVATTVIEVGVDVPNANLMVIENPERLGLSQLHQLRGRVGRGGAASYCLLLFQSPLSEHGRQRLGILRDSDDGFVIAEKDLQLRGPGEFLGTRQTGALKFRAAELSRDADLLDATSDACHWLEQHHPDLIPLLIERWLGQAAHYAEV
ncbi:MAG: ATP-dependent DNA helicase RecG [Methylococcales bacterium]|nr:ATP-dependent DNA helicase RecG [Methylococcales bacterium]